MNTLTASTLLVLTSLIGHQGSIKQVSTPKDTTASESRIELYPINKSPLRTGLNIDPNFLVAKLQIDSKMPVVHLDVNSKMPIARLEGYIAPLQVKPSVPKIDSMRRNFYWYSPK